MAEGTDPPAGELPPVCAMVAGDGACDAPPRWAILVGMDGLSFACDAHRNDLLARHDPKDVSGLVPLDRLES